MLEISIARITTEIEKGTSPSDNIRVAAARRRLRGDATKKRTVRMFTLPKTSKWIALAYWTSVLSTKIWEIGPRRLFPCSSTKWVPVLTASRFAMPRAMTSSGNRT